ncbi:MAG: class A beta-lactamase-related serine hydrolase [Bacilli bacterium]|nr:class A beta-lactamase-related serine hydrolase [Bacilli bacterium]
MDPDVIDVTTSKYDVNLSGQTSEEQLEKYNDCINAPFSEELDYTDDFMEYSLEVLDYITNNYKASVVYENLATGYSLTIHPESVYYAASTIKALGALYIYTGAAKGEINLDETIKYESKYKYKASKGMEQHKIGEELTLRKLVSYSIIYSDNSAHQMLMDYIGNPTLREFGLSLGAKYTLQSAYENFGNISGWDALIYIKAINEFINENPVLGAELQEMLINAEQNDLEITDLGIKAAHKYGSYSSYYHDYGIVYAESPYVVVILTTEGKGDYQGKVKNINRHIYELNQLLTNNRKNRCQIEVYGK